MSRKPVKSKNARDAVVDGYRNADYERRGFNDGMADSQPCELPPPEISDQDLRDAWTVGYRRAWAQRKGVLR